MMMVNEDEGQTRLDIFMCKGRKVSQKVKTSEVNNL